ncbi:hypothetical protein MMC10_003182 [Thelotrema lepadinum]|nr:hypothetical protein [Thelotrema lepadinum]
MDKRPANPQEPPIPRSRPTDSRTIVQNATITFYLAGFSCKKIRQMLETVQNFATVDESRYSLDNLEKTCRSMQTQNRDDENNANPWLRIVMSSTSPFQLRRGANTKFATHFPEQASQITEEDDFAEMRVWQSRWREEVTLLKRSPFYDFRDKASAISKSLDEYQRNLVKEDSEPGREQGRIKVSSSARALIQRAKSLSKKTPEPLSPRRGRNSRPTSRTSSPAGQAKPQRIPHPGSRPALKLTTRGVSLARAEGTATPGRAQYLDPDGFFSPRPKSESPPRERRTA